MSSRTRLQHTGSGSQETSFGHRSGAMSISSTTRVSPCLGRAGRLFGALLTSAVLAGSAALIAQPATNPQGWSVSRTDFFEVFVQPSQRSAPLDESTGTSLATSLENLRRTLIRIDPTVRERAIPRTKVYLFASEEDFVPFSLVPSSTVGSHPPYLFRHEHGIFAALPTVDSDGPRRLVYQQYIRYVLSDSAPHLPTWLVRGFSDFYSTLSVVDGTVRIGAPPFDRQRRMSSVPRIHEFFVRPEGALNVGLNLPRWALVHMLLIGDDELRQRVRPWLEAMAAGERAEPAFWKAFAIDPDALQERLLDYVNQDSFRVLTLPEEGEPVRPTQGRLTVAESAARLGELCLYGGLTLSGAPQQRASSCARERLQTVLDYTRDQTEPAPGDLRARAIAERGLGLLARADGEPDVAIGHLENALDFDPDPRTQAVARLALADSLLERLGNQRPSTPEQTQDLARALDLLRAGLADSPELAQAWVLLGYGLNLAPQTDRKAVDDAVQALERAWQLLPARTDVGFNLLVAYARAGSREQAYALFDELVWRGASDATQSRARELLYQIDFRSAHQASRSERIGDAVALYSRIIGGSTSPALVERASAELDKLERVEQHNDFVAAYQQAVLHIRQGEFETAHQLATELETAANSPVQREVVEALIRRILTPRD